MEQTMKEAHRCFVAENPNVKIPFSQFAKLRPKNTKPARHKKIEGVLLRVLPEYFIQKRENKGVCGQSTTSPNTL